MRKMADEDEIDILGDFSFNSCFAQNNQGIPSCSSREDTVHPQWLLDSTEANWYDTEKDKSATYSGPLRKLIGDKSAKDEDDDYDTSWSPSERKLLVKEMAKYGRNVKKISQVIKSKTEAEIQALIDAEYGVNLETSSYGIDKCDDHDTPTPIQEEIVTESTIKKVTIPPLNVPKHPFRKKNYNNTKTNNKRLEINNSKLFYDEDMNIVSSELIGSELEVTNSVGNNLIRYQKTKGKKIGNHRRKVSRSYDKGKARNRSKDLLKSPQGRQRKDSSLSDDSIKSPKLQIVLGSGQALPVSEGEQVIKIEKKKDSEPESDIDIDIDSDNEDNVKREQTEVKEEVKPVEEPIAVPLRKFEPMPRRQKRIKMEIDGAGGYTIMHTDAGDLYEVGTEPKRERAPRKQTIHLIRCRFYNAEKPAPFTVWMHVSALILMDAHAHTSRAEVMGLAGGRLRGGELRVAAYCPALAAAGATHCDMDPVSAAASSERLEAKGVSCVGWHHSHPTFPAAPSRQDLATQRALQQADPRQLLAVVTSPHWLQGRTCTHYRCFRVEPDPSTPEPVGYQLQVKLVPDLTPETLPSFLEELRATLVDVSRDAHAVDMVTDVCPVANITYLDKCIASVSHHLSAAGYPPDHLVTTQLLHSLRDVFR